MNTQRQTSTRHRKHCQGEIQRPFRKRLLAASMSAVVAGALLNSTSAMAQVDKIEAPQETREAVPLSKSAKAWLGFITQIRNLSQQSYRTNAQELERQSREAALAAERGDLGLTLSASHSRFPDGLGGDVSNGTTNSSLEKYTDVRLNYRLFDQLLRKGSRVDAAKARLKQAEYEVTEQTATAAIELARGSAQAWSEKYQYQALSEALEAIQAAKKKLKLSAEASMPEITEATLANEAEALILHNEITSAFDSLSPFEPSAPRPPEDYTVLPLRAPGSDDIVRLANQSPEAKMLELESTALKEEAQSYRGNGIDLDLFAGQVYQETAAGGPELDDGPQYGAVLTIPLGANDYYRGKALRLQSEARRRQAADALLVRQRELIQLRNEWSQSVAAMSRATERMRQQNRILTQMRKRAEHPGSGRAPHPWQIDVENARFWLRVAETWNARGEWLSNLLAWAVVEPEFLTSEFRESNYSRDNAICAPLYEC
ncbi:TolC family protein [Litorivivens sp.]|uniref:TolC family protein n=1 Tax=Litorivivens sp. TaxID=2020868 RepID=UPI00356A6B7C